MKNGIHPKYELTEINRLLEQNGQALLRGSEEHQ